MCVYVLSSPLLCIISTLQDLARIRKTKVSVHGHTYTVHVLGTAAQQEHLFMTLHLLQANCTA